MNTFFLNAANAQMLKGKKITWRAEAYSANRDYEGVCVIRDVKDGSVRKDSMIVGTLECETISGDDLRYAFIADYGLKEGSPGHWECSNDVARVYCYSDLYREVEIISVENED